MIEVVIFCVLGLGGMNEFVVSFLGSFGIGLVFGGKVVIVGVWGVGGC